MLIVVEMFVDVDVLWVYCVVIVFVNEVVIVCSDILCVEVVGVGVVNGYFLEYIDCDVMCFNLLVVVVIVFVLFVVYCMVCGVLLL